MKPAFGDRVAKSPSIGPSAALRLEIATPCRLHFGLLGFGGTGRQFGGVGLMIRPPGLRLRMVEASQFESQGPLADRVAQFAGVWADYHGLEGLPACHVEVLAAAGQHLGLGVGTQLGLAVAAGLGRMVHGRREPAVELARSVGRARRSAVGTYGFDTGGLIVERGKSPGDFIAPLDCRRPVPQEWRFVLLRPPRKSGLAGKEEQQAFEQLPAVSRQVTEELWRELRQDLLPSLEAGDFDSFGESVYRFGRLAGSCFAARQGGPYNGPLLNALVDRIRSLGVRGVGQSSWGPTLFALLPTQDAAEDFCREIHEVWQRSPLEVQISSADNRGATIQEQRE
jgi:beta-ribofuranosylaminobenzene 5'-phosphate synthase